MRRPLSCAALAALMFGLPLLWSLEASVPFRVRRPLVADLSSPLVPVDVPELAYLRMSDGPSTYRLRLVAPHPAEIARHTEIELTVSDYGRTRTVLSAEITVPSGNCAYAARSGQAVPSNASLLFVRQQDCKLEPNAGEREVFLAVRLNKPGGMAVWTAPSGAAKSDAALLIADRTRSQFAGRMLLGFVGYSDGSNTQTRLALLTYVWQLSRRCLVILMAGAVALVGLSGALLSDWDVRTLETGRPLTLQSSLGAFSAALALAVVYACVFPPFQAADEPNHFAGLVQSLGEPQLAREATVLGQLGHFDRIAFHPDEHFNPSDIGHPGVVLTAGSEAPWDLRGRGELTVWRAFAPVLRRANTVGAMLLLARLLNAGVFAISVGLFVGMVSLVGQSRCPIADAFPLFIIPTLPFFGMYLSNYATLCAMYVVFTAAIVLFAWDGRSSYLSGPLMGISWALATSLSRSALPLAPVLISCALARLIIGPRETSKSGAVVFWMGLAVPGALALAMIPQMLFDLAQTTVAALPPAVRPFWGVVRHPWILVPIGLVACIVELRLHPSPDDHRALHSRATGVIATAAYGSAALLTLSIALSAFVNYPSTPFIDLQHPPSATSYIAQTLLAAATMFRFGHPDFLTSQSFWSGFGWLDTLLPDSMVATLTVSSGLALVFTLTWIARTGAARIGAQLLLVIAGLVAAFATASFTVVRSTPADLHGRYLLGIYLCLITLCWHWLPRTIPLTRSLTRTAILVGCGLCIIAIHSVAFAMILGRYFG